MKSKAMRLAEHVARRGRREITYWILLAKAVRVGTLRRPKIRCEDVQIIFKEAGLWNGLIWLTLETDDCLLRTRY